jgi:transketolase
MWQDRLDAWEGDRAEYDACLAGTGLTGWEAKLPSWAPGEKVATRVASGDCVNAMAEVVPGLLSGSADLTGNTGTQIKAATALSHDDPDGRVLHYGIREHAMGGIMNGMALHGGVLPVGGTFLNFSDYMRGAVRLAAISQAHVVYSWTHDSVGLGEDGPTHQPIEHLAALRAMPGLLVVRPADANETAQAWRLAVDHDGPIALILSRQGLPVLEGVDPDGLAKGAYTLRPAEDPGIVLVATGSEVSVAVAAADLLADDGIAASVVSLPCWERFEAQSAEYQASVLPDGVPRLSVEAAATFGWSRWVDDSVGIDRFGASAPGDVALRELGINPDNVATCAKALLDRLETNR